MTFKKQIIISFILAITIIAGNVIYWITSDIQQKCYDKIKNKTELNLYEKCSIYSLNLCICAFGWVLSPEATRQQVWCTVPTKRTNNIASTTNPNKLIILFLFLLLIMLLLSIQMAYFLCLNPS